MKFDRLAAAFAIGLTLTLLGCGSTEEEGSDQKGKQRPQEQLEAKRHKVTVASILSGLPGEAGLVVGPPGRGGPELSGGSISTAEAWSTIKVPIAQRVLEDANGPSRITSTQDDQITRAITLSDNDAAAALFVGLEAEHGGGVAGATASVNEMLLHAGDTQTWIPTQGRDGFSAYGQTDWSLANQFKYMAALAGGCVTDPATREYLLGKMASVGGSDTFGLGATDFPASWKGGWGPDPDGRYLVRQMGVMDIGGKPVVVTMAARAEDGSFETGAAMLDDIARATSVRLADQVSAPTKC